MSERPLLRPWVISDKEQVIRLIDGVYREYGDEICLTGADADLLDVEANYRAKQGEFMVLEMNAAVVGSHAVVPLDREKSLATIRRLYLNGQYRGQGFGLLLMDWAIKWARESGLRRLEFWSDTRFSRAHAFFQRVGFERTGQVRHLDDGAMPYSEYFFCGDLDSPKFIGSLSDRLR